MFHVIYFLSAEIYLINDNWARQKVGLLLLHYITLADEKILHLGRALECSGTYCVQGIYNIIAGVGSQGHVDEVAM